MNRVLVVDDEPAMCAALEASFSHNGGRLRLLRELARQLNVFGHGHAHSS